ncbi:MAG: hypothetical protein AAGD25_04955 [Cyanobacteria bacterium P01_F01_bin.150]
MSPVLIVLSLIAQAGSNSDTSLLNRTEILIDALLVNSIIDWIVAGFTITAIVTATIAVWTGNLGKIIDFVHKYIAPAKSEITDEQRQRLRKQLIEVQQSIVAKRLRTSLHELVRIDLEREEQRRHYFLC